MLLHTYRTLSSKSAKQESGWLSNPWLRQNSPFKKEKPSVLSQLSSYFSEEKKKPFKDFAFNKLVQALNKQLMFTYQTPVHRRAPWRSWPSRCRCPPCRCKCPSPPRPPRQWAGCWAGSVCCYGNAGPAHPLPTWPAEWGCRWPHTPAPAAGLWSPWWNDVLVGKWSEPLLTWSLEGDENGQDMNVDEDVCLLSEEWDPDVEECKSKCEVFTLLFPTLKMQKHE